MIILAIWASLVIVLLMPGFWRTPEASPAPDVSFMRFAARNFLQAPIAIAILVVWPMRWANLRLLEALPIAALLVCALSVIVTRDALRAAVIAPTAAVAALAAFYAPNPLALLGILVRAAVPNVCGLAAGAGLRAVFDSRRPRLHRMTGGVAILAALIPIEAARRVRADYRLQPNSQIRSMVISDAPLGSTMEVVQDSLQSARGWSLRADRSRGAPTTAYPDPQTPRIGVSHLSFKSGPFQGLIFTEHLFVYWAFDRQGQLIDVLVYRDVDGL